MAVRTTVVTGWSPVGATEYGRRFAETFDKHWPKSAELIVYVWEAQALPRGEARIMPADVQSFLYRHRENRKAAGKEYVSGWREKHVKAGYCFRFDALKFCQMAMYPWHAAQGRDGILVWLDGDVVTFKDVPEDWVDRLLGAHDVAYLGRAGAHSEIGFVAYRLPQAMPLLKRFHDVYATDSVFTRMEWHSAYIWDQERRACEKEGLRCLNMTPQGRGHVWMQSPLVEYTDHLKGKRKVLDASPEMANARKA